MSAGFDCQSLNPALNPAGAIVSGGGIPACEPGHPQIP